MIIAHHKMKGVNGTKWNQAIIKMQIRRLILSKAKLPNIPWSQLVNREDWVLLFVICNGKLNILSKVNCH